VTPVLTPIVGYAPRSSSIFLAAVCNIFGVTCAYRPKVIEMCA
jgi:hypothetical protein